MRNSVVIDTVPGRSYADITREFEAPVAAVLLIEIFENFPVIGILVFARKPHAALTQKKHVIFLFKQTIACRGCQLN